MLVYILILRFKKHECCNNVKSFSHLFFHYSIIWLLECLKEVFQDLQFSFLNFVIQIMKSFYCPSIKVIKVYVIIVVILMILRMRNHSRF